MNGLRYVPFIILSIGFQSLSGIFGKYAALTLQSQSPLDIATNVFYLFSLGCLCLQAIVWQQALRHFSLSVAYPCMSITSFIVLFSAAVLFQEYVTFANIIGLVLVTTGILIVYRAHGDCS